MHVLASDTVTDNKSACKVLLPPLLLRLTMLVMQATLPKRKGVEGETFKPYMRGVYLAYAMVCYCYFTVAICGYWAFGQSVQDNVLLSIKHPKWVVAAADMFVVVHVFGSYQVSSL